MNGPDATQSTSTLGERPDNDHRSFVAARILAHPDPTRVGDCAVLFDAEETGRACINRHGPTFRSLDGRHAGPLASTRITRAPLCLDRTSQGLRLSLEGDTAVEIDGVPWEGPRDIPAAALTEGVIVLFGRDLVLWIGLVEMTEPAPSLPALVGDSAAMRRLRRQVAQVADLDVPVMLRGETGVGKELVARALHAASRRSQQPYIAVNIAALTPSMAASELFGHKKNSFTGAAQDRKGFFEKADGGTLFLDEIGDATPDIQALLLRVAQSGEIQPVGGTPERVDVRLIAATDANLEEAIRRNAFREPLRQRFTYEICVPPLRERRDDVGLLFFHFLREHLASLGEGHRLSAPDGQPPFVPASLVARLARLAWPGNVRELNSVAFRFAVDNRGRERGQISNDLERLLESAALPRAPTERRALSAAPALKTGGDAAEGELGAGRVQPTDAEVLEAYESEGYSAVKAARRLGVTRSYVDRRLAHLPARKLRDLPDAEIAASLEAAEGDLARAAASLRVSVRALRLHLSMQRKEVTRLRPD